MAQKRMFDRAIIDTDRFMDMPISAKAAYFLLGMEADDEGFVSYKKVMRLHTISEDDVKLLVAKKFLIMFPTGVVVITDWNTNNYLDSRRVRPTQYQKERAQLVLTPTGKYEFSNGLASIEEYRGVERRVEKEISNEISSFLPVHEVEVDKEGNPKFSKSNKKKDTAAFRIRQRLYEMVRKYKGVEPTPNIGDYEQVKKALAGGLTERDITEMVESELEYGKAHTVRGALTDNKIDKRRQENV